MLQLFGVPKNCETGGKGSNFKSQNLPPKLAQNVLSIPSPYHLMSYLYIIKIKHKRDISMHFVLSYLLSYKEIILSLQKSLIANQKLPISLDKFIFLNCVLQFDWILTCFWYWFEQGQVIKNKSDQDKIVWLWIIVHIIILDYDHNTLAKLLKEIENELSISVWYSSFISRILCHNRILPSLKESRLWYSELTHRYLRYLYYCTQYHFDWRKLMTKMCKD